MRKEMTDTGSLRKPQDGASQREELLKACKHRERVNFRVRIFGDPVIAAGQAEAGPFADKTKSIFASDPGAAVSLWQGVDGEHAPRRPCRATVLDPVRGTMIQDS